MDATAVAQVPVQADFGTATLILIEQSARAQKILRLRHLKQLLAELRPEHDRLQEELFGRAS